MRLDKEEREVVEGEEEFEIRRGMRGVKGGE